MQSSSERLKDLARIPGRRCEPGFALIVADDYYDGAETGVAIYPSGAAVRFATLGDSRSRIFRAFELIAIEGSWAGRVSSLGENIGLDSLGKNLLPGASQATTAFFDGVFSAAAISSAYIAEAAIDFRWIAISQVSCEQLDFYRKLNGSPEAFLTVHKSLKIQYRAATLKSGLVD